MPDIVTTLGDSNELGDAKGPGDLWFDVKTLAARETREGTRCAGARGS